MQLHGSCHTPLLADLHTSLLYGDEVSGKRQDTAPFQPACKLAYCEMRGRPGDITATDKPVNKLWCVWRQVWRGIETLVPASYPPDIL